MIFLLICSISSSRPVHLHVADDGLCGEHGRAQQVDFRFRYGAILCALGPSIASSTTSRFGETPRFSRLFFDAFPLFRRDSDVLLQSSEPSVLSSFCEDFHPY